VAENELEEITSFLTSEVYPKGRMTAEFDTIELRDRFKA
jgi:hypothetical protein